MRRARVWLLGLTGGALLAGCAVGPDYQAPDIQVNASYRTVYDLGDETLGLWWLGFQDAALNGLIHRALDNNADIGAALARLDAAAALVRVERSDLFPVIDGTVSGTVRRDADGDTDTSGAGGGTLRFGPDLFGGQRRSVERARAQARAAGFTVDDVRRLTAASVADRYVDLRRTQTRLALLDASLDLQSRTLDIVRSRREAGLAADLDVQRAAADLARTRSQRGTLQAARARAENALAVLLGEVPGDGVAPGFTDEAMPAFIQGPPVAVPARMIRGRPDIRAAEEDLKAAVAAIGVEVADLYPALRLPGSVTASLGGAQASAGDVTAVLSAVLDIPLLDAGRRRAEVRVARARAEAARFAYRQAVLTGLSEVENALAAIQGLRERRDELQRAIDASRRAFDQLNALYREGLASFIDILDAQRTLIASREAYVEAEADLAGAVIDLYRAVGAPTQTPVNAS